MDQVLKGDRLGTADVVLTALARGAIEHARMALGEVVDVHRLLRSVAATGDRDDGIRSIQRNSRTRFRSAGVP